MQRRGSSGVKSLLRSHDLSRSAPMCIALYVYLSQWYRLQAVEVKGGVVGVDVGYRRVGIDGLLAAQMQN